MTAQIPTTNVLPPVVAMSSRFFAQLGDSSDDSSSSDSEVEAPVTRQPAARSVLNSVVIYYFSAKYNLTSVICFQYV